MKPAFILILLFQCCFSFSQKDLRRVSVMDLPADIQNVANISTAVRWTDSLGDNVMVTTKKTIKSDDKDIIPDLNRSRRFRKDNFPVKETIPQFAYHFLIVKDSAILTWKIVGITQLCNEEDENHLKHWFVITDLNNDLRAEAWLVYKSTCISDENYGKMKIVMVEDDTRYGVNGDIDKGHSINQNYFDENFRVAPDVFKKYAVQLWRKFAADEN